MIYIVRRGKLYYAGERVKQQLWSDTKTEAKGLLFGDAKSVVEKSEGVVPETHEIERVAKLSFETDDAARTLIGFLDFDDGMKVEIDACGGPRGPVATIKPVMTDWAAERVENVKVATQRTFALWKLMYGPR